MRYFKYNTQIAFPIMRYKVPQDVQREDKILFFITLKQLVMLLVGGGISYGLYVKFSEIYILGPVELFLIWSPFILSVIIGFVKIKGIPIIKFILLLIEQFIFRSTKRFWMARGGDPFISMTLPFSYTQKGAIANVAPEAVSQDRIKALAKTLDEQTSKIDTIKHRLEE